MCPLSGGWGGVMSKFPFMGPKPQVVPRLTKHQTAQVIADKTGKDPSKILQKMDANRRRRHGKKAKKAARNPFGTLEFALDYAVARLGAARVAHLLGVGEDSLRKGLSPDQTDRKTPDFSIRSLLKLIKVLKDEGHAEYFTEAIQETPPPVNHATLPTVHHGLSLSSATHGDIAKAITEACSWDDADPGITPAEAAAILEAIATHQQATELLRQQVAGIAAGET